MNNIIVTSASGIEAITKNELRNIGIHDTSAINGKIEFVGTMKNLAECNMFLRTADKVLLKLSEFKATTFDQLYQGIYEIPWQDYLDIKGKFIVNGKSAKSSLYALSACQSIIKKSILDKLSFTKKITYFPESGDEYFIDFNIFNDSVIISLNTSGNGLHKRGYRQLVGQAPLKETLAAALIMLSNWDRDYPFIDPFCGSGTLPIEAALIASNIAPGLNRNFALEDYIFFDKKIMDDIRVNAKDSIQKEKYRISGFDIDKNAISLSMKHAENAGVKELIHFQAQDISGLSSRFSNGVIVTNPPYGERLMDKKSVAELYATFGKVYNGLDNWKLCVLTSFNDFERNFGKKSVKNRKLYNARKECRLYFY